MDANIFVFRNDVTGLFYIKGRGFLANVAMNATLYGKDHVEDETFRLGLVYEKNFKAVTLATAAQA